MKRLIDMKGKEQALNRHSIFLIVQVTDTEPNTKQQDVALLINGNTYFYKNAPKNIFCTNIPTSNVEKNVFSILVQNNTWTRSCILAIPYCNNRIHRSKQRDR
jgi:hypothetical protein